MKPLAEQRDPLLTLLELHNTATEGINASPVQWLYKRHTRLFSLSSYDQKHITYLGDMLLLRLIERHVITGVPKKMRKPKQIKARLSHTRPAEWTTFFVNVFLALWITWRSVADRPHSFVFESSAIMLWLSLKLVSLRSCYGFSFRYSYKSFLYGKLSVSEIFNFGSYNLQSPSAVHLNISPVHHPSHCKIQL